jgi:hypothetical protein
MTSDNIKKQSVPPLWKLGVSILIDIIGMITYLIPGLGETFDVIWSPISAIIVYGLYGNVFFSAFNFIEEILPYTDIIPTATIAWLYLYYKGGKSGSKA